MLLVTRGRASPAVTAFATMCLWGRQVGATGLLLGRGGLVLDQSLRQNASPLIDLHPSRTLNRPGFAGGSNS